MHTYSVLLTFFDRSTRSTMTQQDTVTCDVSLDYNEIYEHFLDKYSHSIDGWELIDVDCPVFVQQMNDLDVL